jgi:protein pelota
MVMDEGIAHLCYVKPSITLLKQKIEKNVSKKSSGEEVYKKSIGKFFNECYLAIKSLNFDKVKCLVIASPGFVNEQFMKYIKAQIESENDKLFVKSLEKIILVKCSTGFMGSLNEVLSDPTVMSKM